MTVVGADGTLICMHNKNSGISQPTSQVSLSTSWFQFASAVSAIDAALGKWLTATYGIGLTEYRAALQLCGASNNELRITELAQKVGLNLSSATRLVERMERKGLAFRDTCPDDKRGVYAVITDKGREVSREIQEPFETKIRELLSLASKDYPQLNFSWLNQAFNGVRKLVS